MKRLATALLLMMVSCSQAAQRELVLLLVPIEPVIRAGTVPHFRLTITNVSDHAMRVIDAERRVDLQHTYYKLVVTKDGKPVDIPRAISDPGPVSDKDWAEIPSGGMKNFVLSNFPDQFETLPPGKYEAYVHFWRDPYQSHDTAYKSPMAKFTVAE
jgi:hypothetical protein